MELSEQQRQAVKEWLDQGASLSDVQLRLKSEFGLTLTYIDVRLLVLDIGASVQDKPEPKPAVPPPVAPPPAAPPSQEEDPYADDDLEEGASPTPPLGDSPESPEGGTVTLTLDRLVVPGAMVSGDVTFSDGVKARWLIDSMGRFGLDPETPGYRPSPADLQTFQMQLRLELQRHGYA